MSRLLIMLLLSAGSLLLGGCDSCSLYKHTGTALSELNITTLDSFIRKGCFKEDWPSDVAIRLTGATTAAGTTYSRHGRIKAYYSPGMVEWMKANRSGGQPTGTPIPEGATILAAVYPLDETISKPSGWLTMVRTSDGKSAGDAPFNGWVWGQVVDDPEQWTGNVIEKDIFSPGVSLCSSCHTSAVNNLTFANYENLLHAPETPSYTARFQQAQSDSLQSAISPPPSGKLRQPLGMKDAQLFVDWFNRNVPEFNRQPLPNANELTKDKITAFPPEFYDHTYLELASPESFITSDQCQACHDSTALLQVSKNGLEGFTPANMSFLYNPQDPAAPGLTPKQADIFNISQYGEWDVSIMALAARDPVFHAQAETERVLHKNVDPAVIDNVCYRCHGPMGQRQFHIDQGGDPTQVPYAEQVKPPYINEKNFSHYMIYATPDSQPGAYPPYSQPESQPAFAKYGSLARDGVSCKVCHSMGPKDASMPFDGTHWETFYGYKIPNFAKLETPEGFDYPITSTFQYDLGAINAPPADLNAGYVGAARTVSKPGETEQSKIWAHQQDFGADTRKQDYLPGTEVCSGCHVVIVPKLPMEYPAVRNTTQINEKGEIKREPDGRIVSATYPYDENKTCPPAPRVPGSDKYYNPTLDDCVEVSYEQTTFLEWAASSSFGGAQPQTSCTFCHMPSAQGDNMAIASIETSGIGKDKIGAFPAVPYRADEQTELSANAGYARHRLMGINLFVSEMFQQFPDILGLVPTPGGTAGEDPIVPEKLVNSLQNAEESILTHAPTTVALDICVPGEANTPCDEVSRQTGYLSFVVSVSNFAGHRFPTGAGFRRGWIELSLKDKNGKTLWVSGSNDKFGGILDGATGALLNTEFPSTTERYTPESGLLQPHFGSKEYPYLSKQDQVQIYEVRSLDEYYRLTTSTTRLFHDAKDNRIPPAGWIPPVACGENLDKPSKYPGAATYCEFKGTKCPEVNGLSTARLSRITAPDDEAFTDKDFCAINPPDIEGRQIGIAGVDHVPYRIPLADITGKVARIEAVMKYQATPPYFLRDRFLDGQHFASRSQEGGIKGGLGSAMDRLLYVTSHLDMEIENSIPQQENLPEMASSNWTMNIGSACIDFTNRDSLCPHPTVADQQENLASLTAREAQ